ncbi:MAG: arylsulfatase A-like enzyme [Myxococcota bacterium]|jgi:arylsulfatase A-like enzyme
MKARTIKALVLMGTTLFGVTMTSCQEDTPPAATTTASNSIVIISLDTTRPDHLSVYGYDRPTSPNLEALADDAVVMQNFLTTSSWTLPTHASLFTGLFPSSHGAHYSNEGNVALGDAEGAPQGFGAFRANRLPEQATTLAETLRGVGYQTYAVGAGPWFKPVFGLDQGFDVYDADFDSLAGRPGDEVSQLAMQYIERAGTKPFFLFLNYFDPHDPYDAHGNSWEQFLKPHDDFARSKTLANYDAEILFMDTQIGRVLADLKARGLYETSWIVITSDHGEHFGEHGLEVHGFSLYEDVIRGVLIVKPPRGVAFDVDPAKQVQSVDIMPTLLDALGLEVPETLEGEPLHSVKHPAVAELFRTAGNVQWKGERFRRELKAIYYGDYKLIISSAAKDPDAGLFNLQEDPEELHDLTNERPDVVALMSERLRRWLANRNPLTPERVSDIDPETRRQMEALGYIDPSPDGEAVP